MNDYKKEIEAEQSGKDYEEIRDEMLRKSDHIVEMDNMPPQNHIWVDRGMKMTCENAGHPYHEVWKRNTKT